MTFWALIFTVVSSRLGQNSVTDKLTVLRLSFSYCFYGTIKDKASRRHVSITKFDGSFLNLNKANNDAIKLGGDHGDQSACEMKRTAPRKCKGGIAMAIVSARPFVCLSHSCTVLIETAISEPSNFFCTVRILSSPVNLVLLYIVATKWCNL